MDFLALPCAYHSDNELMWLSLQKGWFSPVNIFSKKRSGNPSFITMPAIFVILNRSVAEATLTNNYL